MECPPPQAQALTLVFQAFHYNHSLQFLYSSQILFSVIYTGGSERNILQDGHSITDVDNVVISNVKGSYSMTFLDPFASVTASVVNRMLNLALSVQKDATSKAKGTVFIICH